MYSHNEPFIPALTLTLACAYTDGYTVHGTAVAKPKPRKSASGPHTPAKHLTMNFILSPATTTGRTSGPGSFL